MEGSDSVVEPKEGIRDLAQTGQQTEADRNTLFTHAARLDPGNPHSYSWGDIRGHGGRVGGYPSTPDGGIYKVIGPEVGLARRLAQQGWQDVAIIKATMNFRRLEMDRSPWVRPNSLWDHWSRFLHTRLAELRSDGRQAIVRGFVWDQGIDDGLLSRSRKSFEADLRQLIGDLRREFADGSTPFVLARSINSPIAGKRNMAPIRAAQMAVAESTPNVAWVDADDLGPYIRQHHLSTEAQLILGRKHAESLLQMTATQQRSAHS